MPIKNYTTDIAVGKSMGEVIGALTRRGVTRVSTVFDEDGNPAGIAFTMKTPYGVREFELPVKVDGVLAAMKRDKVAAAKQTREHAAKVAWRIAKDWLEAQAALIDADLATLDEVMFPYMIANDGRSAFELMRDNALLELES